jgi:hypothetical protein
MASESLRIQDSALFLCVNAHLRRQKLLLYYLLFMASESGNPTSAIRDLTSTLR